MLSGSCRDVIAVATARCFSMEKSTGDDVSSAFIKRELRGRSKRLKKRKGRVLRGRNTMRDRVLIVKTDFFSKDIHPIPSLVNVHANRTPKSPGKLKDPRGVCIRVISKASSARKAKRSPFFPPFKSKSTCVYASSLQPTAQVRTVVIRLRSR